MPSEAAIVNDALSKVGTTAFIDSLEDDTVEAEVAKLHYARRRDEVLETGDWPFATARATLAQLTETRSGWGKVFAFPTDGLKALAVTYPTVGSGVVGQGILFTTESGAWTSYRNLRSEQRIPFKIERGASGKVVLCDFESPELVYVSRVTNPDDFPLLFQDALAWRLALEFAGALKKDPTLMKFAMDAYARALMHARAEAMREAQEDSPPENAILAARR